MAEDIEEQIIQLNDQQSQLYQEGRYEQAIDVAKQAYILAQQHLQPDNRYIVDSLNNIAVLYMEVGKYSEAEPFYLKALEGYRRILTEDDPQIATILSNLGYLYELMGNYTKAEPLLREALQVTLTTLGKQHPDYAFSLNNLALFYYKRLGQYETAMPLFREAVRIYRRLGMNMDMDFAYTLNNLAGLYESMGRYADARPLYKQALRILGEVKGENHPAYAIGLNNLAYLYESMGHYTLAERFYNRALKIRQAVWGDAHPDIADSLNNLAEVYLAMGKYLMAEPFARRAIAMRCTLLGEKHPDVAQSLHSLAGLCAATDRVAEALSLMNEAAAINDWMIGQAFSIGSEQGRIDYLATLHGNFAGFLSLVHQYHAHVLPTVQTALDLVLRRKAIGAEALAIQRDAIMQGRHSSLAPKLKELSNLRTLIAQRTLDGPGVEGPVAHNEQLRDWNAKKERLEAELAHQIPEMNLEQKLRKADRREVCHALPEHSVLIEFVRVPIFNFKAILAQGEMRWLPAHYLAFVLHSGEPENVQMISLGEADAIDQKISTFRIAITGEQEVGTETNSNSLPLLQDQVPLSTKGDKAGNRHVGPVSGQPNRQVYLEEGGKLREAIFDPLFVALNGRTRLFIAPDGDLTRLPFEVLPTKDGHHLIDDYYISYVSVGRDVLRFGTTSTGQPTDPLVVADPDFNLSSAVPTEPTSHIKHHTSGRCSRDLERENLHFERLAGTRVEGMQIANQLGVSPWLDQVALEASLKNCRSPRILHIATHGFFLSDQPPSQREPRAGGRLSQRLENPLLRSGLALAGANTWLQGGTPPSAAEDGLLTAEDVSGLDLLATELVVLSACQTGLGQVHVGEGVFGLRRVFVLAGSKTLVMSLWRVPDSETQQLMDYFYQGLLKGLPRGDALRSAQLKLKAVNPHPRYWGAFICQGDPNPLL